MVQGRQIIKNMRFLRLFDDGDTDAMLRDWPDAPKAIFIDADPLHKPSK